MSTIKINELATGTVTLESLLAFADANGIAFKGSVDKLNDLISTLAVSGMKGAISLTDPAPLEDGFYPCSETGTYTDFGNLYVDIYQSLSFISVSGTQTVFKLVEIPVSIVKDAVPTSGSTNTVESNGVFDENKRLDLKIDANIIPIDSRFDQDSTITTSSIGVFDITTGTATASSFEGGAKIDVTVAGNCILQNTTILNSNQGDTIYYDFYAKNVSGSNRLYLVVGNTIFTPNSLTLDLTSEFVHYTGSLIVGSANPDRLGFISSGVITEYVVKDFNVYLNSAEKGLLGDLKDVNNQVIINSSDISTLDTSLAELTSSNTLVPVNSRFDVNSTIVSGSSVGEWNFQAGTANISIVDDYVKFETSSTGTIRLANSTFITDIPLGNDVNVTMDIRRVSSSGTMYLDVTTSASGYQIPTDLGVWQTVDVKLEKTTTAANRVAFIITSASSPQEFHFRNIKIADTLVELGTILAIDKRVTTLETEVNALSANYFKDKKVSFVNDSIGTNTTNNAREITILASDIGGTVSAYVTINDVSANLTIGGYQVLSSDIGNIVVFTPVSGDIGKRIGKPANYNSLTFDQTCCGILTNQLEMEIVQNVAWSGSSITSHENDIDTYKTSHAWSNATINKLKTRDALGADVIPEVIIIYRGTNDFSHSPFAFITDFGDNPLFTIPSTDAVTFNGNAGFGFKEAYCMTIEKYREAYPFAEIYICTLNLFKRINYGSFPVNNNQNTLPEFNNAIRQVSDLMGTGLIEFDKSGITFENIYPKYADDNATTPTHPNTTGHIKISKKAVIDIKK